MERHTRQSADITKWSALLVEAVNKPGLLDHEGYTAFWIYSVGNRILVLKEVSAGLVY